jgi:hypothetical protein
LAKGQEAPFANPCKKREAQDQGEIRVAFLLDTFLWPNKEKYLGSRSENRLQKGVAIATPCNFIQIG